MFTIEKNVKFELWNFTRVTSLWKILITKNSNYPSKHSSWWGRLEDVLKTSFVFVFRRCPDQDECICLSHSSSEDVFKILVLAIRLQDVFKTFSRRLQDIFVFKTSSRRLQNVFKTSAKTSSRHLQDVLQGYLQDVLKTYRQVKLFA